MPKANMVQKSGFKFNITEPFVDIRYTGTGSAISCISLFKIIVSMVIILNLLWIPNHWTHTTHLSPIPMLRQYNIEFDTKKL